MSKPNAKVENISGDEYMLGCYCCGTTRHIMQVAMRNSQGIIVGYMFSCDGCFSHISGKNLGDVERLVE